MKRWIFQIHARLEDFEDALKTFNVAKDKFEQTVEVLTFGGVVRADLTSYSFSLNVLIEEAIEFNEFFKNLNEKYLFNGEITDSNKSLFIGHYFYEYGHKINELVYYKYLKSFNNVNECDLSSLYDSQVFKNDNIIKDYYMNGTHLAQMLPERVDYINSDYSSEDVEIFKEIRDGFLQKFDIYKLVYSNMNYYEYNANFIQGQAKVDEFEKELSSVEKANINIVEKFYETTVLDYCSDDFWSKSVLYL